MNTAEALALAQFNLFFKDSEFNAFMKHSDNLVKASEVSCNGAVS